MSPRPPPPPNSASASCSSSSTFKLLPFSSPSFSPLPHRATPPNLSISHHGEELSFECKAGANWWRCPFPVPGREEVNGPGWGFERKISGGFEVRCEIEIGAKYQYYYQEYSRTLSDASDQAQLMLWLSPTEWIKCGAEYDNDALWHGVVVCNPFSDWSIQTPVTGPAVFTISYDPSITTLSVYLNDKLIRQVKTFGLLSAGYEPGRVTIPFDPKDKGPEAKLRDKEVWVGVMGCAPKGPKGPESEGEGAVATFRRFEMREGVRS